MEPVSQCPVGVPTCLTLGTDVSALYDISQMAYKFSNYGFNTPAVEMHQSDSLQRPIRVSSESVSGRLGPERN